MYSALLKTLLSDHFHRSYAMAAIARRPFASSITGCPARRQAVVVKAAAWQKATTKTELSSNGGRQVRTVAEHGTTDTRLIRVTTAAGTGVLPLPSQSWHNHYSMCRIE